MNQRIERVQQEIIKKLNQQGGELDLFALYYEYHQRERILVKKALVRLEAEKHVNINFGQVTQNFA